MGMLERYAGKKVIVELSSGHMLVGMIGKIDGGEVEFHAQEDLELEEEVDIEMILQRSAMIAVSSYPPEEEE